MMAWMPIIATALTIAEVSQDDEEVNAADSSALMNIATTLRENRQQGLRLEAELASIKVTETEILTLQAKLQATAQFLDPVEVRGYPAFVERAPPANAYHKTDQPRVHHSCRLRRICAQRPDR